MRIIICPRYCLRRRVNRARAESRNWGIRTPVIISLCMVAYSTQGWTDPGKRVTGISSICSWLIPRSLVKRWRQRFRRTGPVDSNTGGGLVMSLYGWYRRTTSCLYDVVVTTASERRTRSHLNEERSQVNSQTSKATSEPGPPPNILPSLSQWHRFCGMEETTHLEEVAVAQ